MDKRSTVLSPVTARDSHLFPPTLPISHWKQTASVSQKGQSLQQHCCKGVVRHRFQSSLFGLKDQLGLHTSCGAAHRFSRAQDRNSKNETKSIFNGGRMDSPSKKMGRWLVMLPEGSRSLTIPLLGRMMCSQQLCRVPSMLHAAG